VILTWSSIKIKINKYSSKMVERGNIDTPLIHEHDRSLSWLSTGISIIIKKNKIKKRVAGLS
jgi:hypothetical protein